MAKRSVFTEQDGRVYRIVLSKPRAGNAIDMAMAEGLGDAVRSVPPDIGCVLIAADGANFCVGGDVDSFAAAPDRKQFLAELATALHVGIEALAKLDVPVVAAVQGYAAGAGLSLAAVCDIVLAAESARFYPAYSAIGLTPDGGMSWTLPRKVGAGRAAELLLANATWDAQTAQTAGLVSRVVSTEALLSEANELAAKIADGARIALATTKRLLRESERRTLVEQLAAEAESIANSAGGDEGQEGVDAFLAKRPPAFH